jgi:1-acyl-sn-glycerol-3-phosphate acyltransferase
MRAAFKLLGVVVVIPTLLVHHFILYLMIRDDLKRASILSHSLSRYCRLILKICSIKVTSSISEKDTHNKLVVSNHMSYLDVICLSSLYPTTYVTSVEVKETAGLGHICRVCGCFFTERRRKGRDPGTIHKEIAHMGQHLSYGLSITLFPEGTSTDGMKILPFKTPLLEAAVANQKSILPVSLKYVQIDGKPFSHENKDLVCWYGDATFIPHFLTLLKVGYIDVTIEKGPVLEVTPEVTRYDLGLKSFEVINGMYFGSERSV